MLWIVNLPSVPCGRFLILCLSSALDSAPHSPQPLVLIFVYGLLWLCCILDARIFHENMFRQILWICLSFVFFVFGFLLRSTKQISGKFPRFACVSFCSLWGSSSICAIIETKCVWEERALPLQHARFVHFTFAGQLCPLVVFILTAGMPLFSSRNAWPCLF
jgi:hypothetical protein